MTIVRKHPRKGTKGVKRHFREISNKRKVPKRHEYTQEGRYGTGYYRTFEFSPRISEQGDIDGYDVRLIKQRGMGHSKFVFTIRQGINWVDDQLD